MKRGRSRGDGSGGRRTIGDGKQLGRGEVTMDNGEGKQEGVTKAGRKGEVTGDHEFERQERQETNLRDATFLGTQPGEKGEGREES